MSSLFSGDCTFVMGCPRSHLLPDSTLPEVAFCGLSNVGKSSLINTLVNRKSLVRVSNTPGRTQEINFFDLAGKILLVDLPGYGYAEAPLKSVANWNKLIRQYLKGRPQLRRVFLLIDSRRGVKSTDIEIFTLLDQSAVSYQIVLTKIDKLKKDEIETCYQKTLIDLKPFIAAHPHVLMCSSITREGISALQEEITQFAVA